MKMQAWVRALFPSIRQQMKKCRKCFKEAATSPNRKSNTANYHLVGLQTITKTETKSILHTFFILFLRKRQMTSKQAVIREVFNVQRMSQTLRQSSESPGFVIVLGWVCVQSPGPQVLLELGFNELRCRMILVFIFLSLWNPEVHIKKHRGLWPSHMRMLPSVMGDTINWISKG